MHCPVSLFQGSGSTPVECGDKFWGFKVLKERPYMWGHRVTQTRVSFITRWTLTSGRVCVGLLSGMYSGSFELSVCCRPSKLRLYH